MIGAVIFSLEVRLQLIDLRFLCKQNKKKKLRHVEVCHLAHSRESETFVDFREKISFLLNHISRFLSQQFVIWYLRSISKTKL